MIIDCPKMAPYRDSCGIGPYVRAHRRASPGISSIKLYSLYLDDTLLDSIKGRSLDLYAMKVGWHALMKIEL